MNNAIIKKEIDFSPDQVELIRKQIAPNANADELKLFLYQCRRTGLDPLEFRKIPDYEGYVISITGEVFSFKRNHFLSKRYSVDGYRRVALCKDGVMRSFSNHILVISLFQSPKPFDKAEVNHIDADKNNNHLSNLEWSSKTENMQHAKRMGLRPCFKGENNPAAKLSSKDIPVIRQLLAKGQTLTQIGKTYNVSLHLISKIKKGKLWKTA